MITLRGCERFALSFVETKSFPKRLGFLTRWSHSSEPQIRRVQGASKSFESVYFNNLVIVLDGYFIHRTRGLEKKVCSNSCHNRSKDCPRTLPSVDRWFRWKEDEDPPLQAQSRVGR